MADKQGDGAIVDTIRDLIIVQLLIAKIPQRNVQRIVKCDRTRIAAIAKEINKGRKEGAA